MTQRPFNFTSPPQPDRAEHVPKPKKRIQVTTLEAWNKLLPILPRRERAVMEALTNYHLGLPGIWPTAYELYHFMKKRDESIFDINHVRPVLTRLKDKSLVEFGKRKSCLITGQNVYTWRFVEQIQLTLWGRTDDEI